jgi:hypothetical protein
MSDELQVFFGEGVVCDCYSGTKTTTTTTTTTMLSDSCHYHPNLPKYSARFSLSLKSPAAARGCFEPCFLLQCMNLEKDWVVVDESHESVIIQNWWRNHFVEP